MDSAKYQPIVDLIRRNKVPLLSGLTIAVMGILAALTVTWFVTGLIDSYQTRRFEKQLEQVEPKIEAADKEAVQAEVRAGEALNGLDEKQSRVRDLETKDARIKDEIQNLNKKSDSIRRNRDRARTDDGTNVNSTDLERKLDKVSNR